MEPCRADKSHYTATRTCQTAALFGISGHWPTYSSWVDMVADRPYLSIKLARRWDNLSMVRSRFRKGKPWLKTRSNKDGDLIIDTPALEWNHPILTATLQSCGPKPLSIDEMVKQVGCILVIYIYMSILWSLSV